MDPLSLSPDRAIGLGAIRIRIAEVPRLFAEEWAPTPKRPQTMWLQLQAALRRRAAAQTPARGRPRLRGVLIAPQNIAGTPEIG
jgi:hypothetical protein